MAETVNANVNAKRVIKEVFIVSNYQLSQAVQNNKTNPPAFRGRVGLSGPGRAHSGRLSHRRVNANFDEHTLDVFLDFPTVSILAVHQCVGAIGAFDLHCFYVPMDDFLRTQR